MEEGGYGEVEHEPLGEVAVSLVQEYEPDDGQTADGRERTHTCADCSHGKVGSRVVRLEAVASSRSVTANVFSYSHRGQSARSTP